MRAGSGKVIQMPDDGEIICAEDSKGVAIVQVNPTKSHRLNNRDFAAFVQTCSRRNACFKCRNNRKL